MNIGDHIIDSDGHCCEVVDVKTTNLGVFVNVYHLKKTNKGINCTQWYEVNKFFNSRFKTGLKGYLEWLGKASYEEIKIYFKTKEKLNDR